MSVYAEFHAPPTSYPPLGETLTEYADVSVEVDRIVPTGGSTHYVWITGEGHESLVERLREAAPVTGFAVVDELPDHKLIRFEWSSLESPIFRILQDTEATLTGVRGTPERWTFRLRFPDQDALTAFYESCQDQVIPVQLRQIFQSNSFPDEDEYGVTTKQAETLVAAFDAGYFEIPREVTLAELAEQLGVSEQAVSERLRRGLSTLLTSTVSVDGSGDSTQHGASD